MTGSGSVSFTVPFSADVWRAITGWKVCEACRTPVALFDICEEDDEGWPIPDRPTGERRWSEMADPPDFGVEHTPERCRTART